MHKLCRNNYIDGNALRLGISICLVLFLLAGCGKGSPKDQEMATGAGAEESANVHVDMTTLQEQNEDIFAWINVPGTGIDYPVCQSGEGDDSFYITHNYLKQEDPKGAIYTECANLKNMCDFNEVLHGSSPEDGTMFSDLQKFLDKKFFDEHEYIYVYTEDNALIYMIFAAYTREDIRLIEEYDFTYVSGCKAFLDEIYQNRSMSKQIRSGWENMVQPENFIITLTTRSKDDPSKQTVVIGCLVGDLKGTIDRYLDYSDGYGE